MKLQPVFLLICMGLALANGRKRYDGYKVYQVTPKSKEEADFLNTLQDNPSFDFWAAPRALNVLVTVMVSPNAQIDFEADLNMKRVDFNILIANLESKIQEESFRQRISPRMAIGDVSFTYFMRYSEITQYLQTLGQNNPDVTVINIGQSYEGRDILGVKISSGGSNKPTIFIDAGIHAREWIAPPTAVYIINQLVENSDNAALYRDVDWVVIPCLNPDGYEYTHTNERMWRKTRTPNSILCLGVDPNRNFDYFWMLVGASASPCSDIYGGPSPFSETETSALRDYLLEHRDDIKLYLTFHSYGQYLLYPWGYTSALPDNNDELYALGQAVDAAISAVNGTRYQIGTSTNVLYAAAGGSDDYAKGVAGIELSYTIELPGGGSTGFDPVATRILPIVEETWEGIKAYHAYIEQKYVQSDNMI